MKSYTTAKVAKVQATTRTNKTGEHHIWVQHGKEFLVGTDEEITMFLMEIEQSKQVAEEKKAAKKFKAAEAVQKEVADAATIEAFFKLPVTGADDTVDAAKVLLDATKSVPETDKTVEAVFKYLPEVKDEKYLHILVSDKEYRLAVSRIEYQIQGDEVVVKMTRKYAKSRPELKVAA